MPLTSLPLFPLDLVLYPNEVLPLHIFEDRYKTMIADCTLQDVPFGVVLSREGKMEEVGCSAMVSKVSEVFEGGEKDIIVTGMERFRITGIHRDRPYLTADIIVITDRVRQQNRNEVERVIAQHIKLLELAGRTPSPSLYQERDRLSFFIAHNAGLTLDQKQDVLELDAEIARIAYLIEHLEQFIPAVEEAEFLRKQIRSNGHFKDYPPEG